MCYKDLLDRYTRGETTPEETERIAQALDKYRALGDYVMEHDTLPPDALPDLSLDSTELRRVRRAVRRRSALHILAAAVLAGFLVFVAAQLYQTTLLPLLNKALFLSPDTADTFGDMSDLDAALGMYEELYHPGGSTLYVHDEATGLGKYDLSLYRYDLLRGDGKPTFSPGTLDKGRFSFEKNFQTGVASNGFTRGLFPFHEPWDGQLPAQAAQSLSALPDYTRAYASLSFRQDLSMSELTALMQAHPDVTFFWVGVRHAPEDRQVSPIIGFRPTGVDFFADSMQTRYPYLQPYFHKDEAQETVLTKHFEALLAYQADHAALFDAIAQASAPFFADYTANVQEYIAQNGVKTYGVYASGRPSDLLPLCTLPEVEQVAIENLVLSASY